MGGTPVVAAASCAQFFESNISGIAAELAFGPQNRIWITEGGLAQPLLRGISPAGGPDVVFPLGNVDVSGMYDPQGIAAGADGRLWIAGGPLGRTIAAIDPTSGAIVGYPLDGAPMRIAAGPDGNLWVTLNSADAIAKVNTSGYVIAKYPLASGAAPLDITAASDGALWFTESGAAKIGRLTTAGTLSEFPIGADPFDIAASGGDIWFTERAASQVGHLNVLGGDLFEVATPTAAAGPFGITVGADGGVWFAEHNVSKIGRLDPLRIDPILGTHVIDETLITTSSSPPTAMLAIPDGTIWFAIEVNHLEHFKPNQDGTVGPLPPMVALTAGSPMQTTSAGPVYSTSTTFTIGASASGQCLDTVTYRVSAQGATPGAFGPPMPASASFTLGNGTWVVEFYGTGPGGQSLTQSVILTVDQSRFAADTAPPVLALPADVRTPATSVWGATVTYSVTSTDLVDPAPAVSCTPPSGSLFPIGTTTVWCAATDRTGNVARGSFAVTVTAGPPVVTVPPDIFVASTGSSTFVTFTAAAQSPWGGSLPVTCTPPGLARPSPGTFTLAFPSDISTTVTCVSAVDGLGQSGSGSFIVRPITPPVLHLPPNITVVATGTTANVLYVATATTGTGAAVAITCTPASGTAFAIGTTLISCSASDRAVITTGSFSITVLSLPLVLPTQFVIWGGNNGGVQVGQRVQFWGAKWGKQVARRDGETPQSFKGYADTVSGTSWSARPGRGKPPTTIVTYISVIVTTEITKDGDRISGNVSSRVIIRVDDPASYRADPGHAAFGVVVATLP